MVSISACYPGQGAQKEHMALDFYRHSSRVRDLFHLVTEITQLDVKHVLETYSEQQLRHTEIAQIVVTLANRSAHIALQEHGITFDSYAGFSLGELSAYAGSGVINDQQLFALVQKRGQLMAKAYERALKEHGELSMAAVINLGYETVLSLIQEHSIPLLYCANDNSDFQVTIAGSVASIETITPLLKEAGAKRVIPLRVSAPFHTPFLASMVDEYSEFVESLDFNDPIAPLYLNSTAQKADTAQQVKEGCITHLYSVVKWRQIMKEIGPKHKHMIEIGPGSVLSGFFRTTDYPIDTHVCGTYEQVEQVSKELQ
ncbi:MAG: ACP S-malonyltransferase [Sphaerochaetaceae bacterium]